MMTAKKMVELTASHIGGGRKAEPAPAPRPKAEPAGQPLNFRVTADFRRRFRVFAAERNMTLSQVLAAAFRSLEAHGVPDDFAP